MVEEDEEEEDDEEEEEEEEEELVKRSIGAFPRAFLIEALQAEELNRSFTASSCCSATAQCSAEQNTQIIARVQIILKQTIKRKKNLYHPIDFVS
jgi:hypothetical protein